MRSYFSIRTIFLINCMLVLALSSCVTFKDRNNQKFKQWNLSKDGYNLYKGKYGTYFEPFDLHNYINQTTTVKPQIVKAADITKLKELNKDFTLVLWYPTCPSSERILSFVRHLDSIKTPYLLASATYDLTNVSLRFQQAGLTNQNIYIVPSAGVYDERINVKWNQFLKDVCAECAQTYNDELMYSDALIFRKGKPTEVIFDLSEVKVSYD